MGMSSYLKALVLGAVLSSESFAIRDVFVSLHSSDPGVVGLFELASNNNGTYKRQRVSAWIIDSDGSYRNSDVIDFADMPAGPVVGVGLWDAVQGGQFLWGGVFVESKRLNEHDIFRFPAHHLLVDLVT